MSEMPLYVLSHRHDPEECRFAFAAWKGFTSPLRHTTAVASCIDGGHRAWWQVEAGSAEDALALLPPYVAERTVAEAAHEITMP